MLHVILLTSSKDSNLTPILYNQQVPKRFLTRLTWGWNTYHWFIIERESLHGSQSIGCRVDLFENHKCLAPHLQGLHCHYVQDLTKLWENGVKGLLQLWNTYKKYLFNNECSSSTRTINGVTSTISVIPEGQMQGYLTLQLLGVTLDSLMTMAIKF